jgi:hypothetical protein
MVFATVHYDERNQQYHEVCRVLKRIGFDYKSVNDSENGLSILTPAGRFTGNEILEFLVESKDHN